MVLLILMVNLPSKCVKKLQTKYDIRKEICEQIIKYKFKNIVWETQGLPMVWETRGLQMLILSEKRKII